ncbi:MAG: trypsin-like peptidase domain-containing protein [Planctomycetia bacterium]|nr:trypsin-like peptidase domain-containing protein [Planctomycetia bacterium]
MRKLIFLMFLGGCAFAGGLASVALSPRLTALVAAQTNGSVVLPAPGTDVLKVGDRFELVAKRVSPAVVSVEATKPGAQNANGQRSRAVDESGSGVLVKVNGRPGSYALTNNHVVSQARPEQITLHLADGRVLRPAQVWTDPESDIAVMRVDADNLPAAPLGDSDQVRVGQWVLAFGSPFGLNQTVTHGIISARERGQVSLGSTIRIKDFLQTDAAINPGSSGGPLVNLEGEVIGLNTAIASQSGASSGVAFAIPINLVKRVMGQLLENGSVARGYLGVQLAGSFEPADALKLGLNRVQGALVEAVYPDTPAAAAGLRQGDVLLQVDDLPIRTENHLINHVSALPPGQKIRLQVWRERRALQVEVTVGDWARGQARFRAQN